MNPREIAQAVPPGTAQQPWRADEGHPLTKPALSTAGHIVPERGDVVEWRPGKSEAGIWNLLGVAVTVIGLVMFSLPLMFRSGLASGSMRISPFDVLLVVGLTVLVVVGHEAIHAAMMLAFGARPQFGTTLVGKVVPALYATATGHRFTRNQYLAIAGAPAVLVSGLGLWACFGPWAGYLILPLALHLGGCVGDGIAMWRVLREPPGTEYEDLRDGIRFHRLPASRRLIRPGRAHGRTGAPRQEDA